MSFFTFAVWTALIYIIIAGAFPLVCQFYWYLAFGTVYDVAPWVFSYMTNGDYVVLPEIDPTLDTSLTQLSPVQQQMVNRYVFTAMIFTYIWSSWPVIMNNNGATSEGTPAQTKLRLAQTTSNVIGTQRRAKETMSNMIRRIRSELSATTGGMNDMKRCA